MALGITGLLVDADPGLLSSANLCFGGVMVVPAVLFLDALRVTRRSCYGFASRFFLTSPVSLFDMTALEKRSLEFDSFVIMIGSGPLFL